jgi:hypothetical protein
LPPNSLYFLQRPKKWPSGKIVKAKYRKARGAEDNRTQDPDKRAIQTVKILCDVDQVECLRHGVDAPSSAIKIEVDPKSLTEEQRNFVASQLYDELRFPNSPGSEICPPTYEGFIAAVNYGLEKDKIESRLTVDGALQYSHDLMKELKELRQSLIKTAIKESGQAGRVVEQAHKDRMDFIRKGSGGGWNGDRTV